MSFEALITIISVITTGTVSVIGVLIPAVLESQKAQREAITAKIDRIYEKAEQLSQSLATFRNPAYLKEKGIDIEARIELRANHDSWEMAVFSELSESQRQIVRDMRKSMYGWGKLTTQDENGEAHIMKLIDHVIGMSCSAISSLDKSRSRKVLGMIG